mmetsp:Transcript_27040/g.75923  ORF Transcript_27040/g.75923 Transcript_27040/m.75923 type:complete len:220 (+) Transcript_27040:425-1084(+)
MACPSKRASRQCRQCRRHRLPPRRCHHQRTTPVTARRHQQHLLPDYLRRGKSRRPSTGHRHGQRQSCRPPPRRSSRRCLPRVSTRHRPRWPRGGAPGPAATLWACSHAHRRRLRSSLRSHALHRPGHFVMRRWWRLRQRLPSSAGAGGQRHCGRPRCQHVLAIRQPPRHAPWRPQSIRALPASAGSPACRSRRKTRACGRLHRRTPAAPVAGCRPLLSA